MMVLLCNYTFIVCLVARRENITQLICVPYRNVYELRGLEAVTALWPQRLPVGLPLLTTTF